jgi:hypothetical protein
MTKLATVTVGVGGTASISFTNIPQNYTDLKVVASCRVSRAGVTGSTIAMIFNGVTSGYSDRTLRGSGIAAASSTFAGADIRDFIVPAADATANTFSNQEFYIPNYAGSTNKSISIDSVMEDNVTQASSNLTAGLSSNPAAITSITFTEPNGPSNFVQHSTFTLYGIKNAQRTAGNSIKATGGNIVFDGTYVYHVYPSSGTFTSTQPLLVDYFIVAGGGGGAGAGSTWSGSGGGGGGQILSGRTSVTAASNTVVVGAGGAAGTGASPNGGNAGSASSFFTLSATGGARGIAFNGLGNNGGASGSGNAGGTGAGSSTPSYGGGGGGGNSAVGQNGSSTGGGAGGSGTSYSIDGYSLGYGGGGGGGLYGNTTAGTQGLGSDGGGNGNAWISGTGNTGNSAVANRGGGGGGAGGGNDGSTFAGGAGGSGIVIIRYKG